MLLLTTLSTWTVIYENIPHLSAPLPTSLHAFLKNSIYNENLNNKERQLEAILSSDIPLHPRWGIFPPCVSQWVLLMPFLATFLFYKPFAYNVSSRSSKMPQI